MKKILLLALTAFIASEAIPQVKKSLTIDDLVKWNRITERVISDDGSFAAFVIQPWDGDPSAEIYNAKGSKVASFPCASGISITCDSRFAVFTIVPPDARVTELKLKKTKKEDMPLNMLGIYDLKKNRVDTIARLKTFRVPRKWSGWIVYQCEPGKVNSKTAGNNASAKPEEQKEKTGSKPKTESEENGFHLIIRNLNDGGTDTVWFVTAFQLAEEAPFLICTTTGNSRDGKGDAGVMLKDLGKNRSTFIFKGKGKFRQLTISKKGDNAAFLVSSDEKDKTGNTYSLYRSVSGAEASMVADSKTPGIPEGWIISEYGRLSFSEKTARLFFGTSPAFRQKDTTVLDEDRPNLDIWHYAEGELHSAQVINRQRDARRTYTAVWLPDKQKVFQLGTPERPDIQLIDKGDAPQVLAMSNLPYELESMWEGNPERYDIWLVDILTGTPTPLKTNYRARFRVSPAGKYLYWYHSIDSSWYTMSISDRREYRLTSPLTLPCHDELNDVPNYAGSYPAAGWLKDDKAFLVSDRYDIWSLDPEAERKPENITLNGRKNKINYSLIDFDPENEYIDPSEGQYLSGFNEVTRQSGIYSSDLRKKKEPEMLLGGDFRLGTPVKAGKADIIIYTKESFEMFPDYHISDLTLKKSVRLTDANPQQKDFLWGSAEVVSWTSLDGMKVEGLLYKPAGFDPSVKYPMIVNFYEKSSEGLFSHRIPEAHRSTIDYHYYTSNGYLVFNPDVLYTNGYPGQSAYNCVMPGVMSLVQKGFVDEKRIGAQGHSWGGYQVAYLATRTNLFAAIESGAPVVNMYSAYGGIRWETGVNRSMQYEHQQSRIGATIWEAPHLYWENSPLFAIEKVQTPILIMSNDQDGAVPWWQGIEFFVAMRRLGKPAWLLNYNGEPHWPQKMPNKIDFQKRMSQFFGHYLKGEPMPKWMKEGVPATEKDFTLGY